MRSHGTKADLGFSPLGDVSRLPRGGVDHLSKKMEEDRAQGPFNGGRPFYQPDAKPGQPREYPYRPSS